MLRCYYAIFFYLIFQIFTLNTQNRRLILQREQLKIIAHKNFLISVIYFTIALIFFGGGEGEEMMVASVAWFAGGKSRGAGPFSSSPGFALWKQRKVGQTS